MLPLSLLSWGRQRAIMQEIKVPRLRSREKKGGLPTPSMKGGAVIEPHPDLCLPLSGGWSGNCPHSPLATEWSYPLGLLSEDCSNTPFLIVPLQSLYIFFKQEKRRKQTSKLGIIISWSCSNSIFSEDLLFFVLNNGESYDLIAYSNGRLCSVLNAPF